MRSIFDGSAALYCDVPPPLVAGDGDRQLLVRGGAGHRAVGEEAGDGEQRRGRSPTTAPQPIRPVRISGSLWWCRPSSTTFASPLRRRRTMPAIRKAITSDVHDRADDEENDEQRVELARLGRRHCRTCFGNAGSCSRRPRAGRQDCRTRPGAHCSAVSDVCAGSRGVSVCGVVLLISSARLRHRVLARLARQRADVGGELPDLVLGQLAAPRRHAVGAAFGDARRDLVDAAAVAPFVVHQRRAHAAAAVAVAADAVHLAEELLALARSRAHCCRRAWRADRAAADRVPPGQMVSGLSPAGTVSPIGLARLWRSSRSQRAQRQRGSAEDEAS